MKAVVQRVKNASVHVEGRVCGAIASGLLVYLGVARGDGPEDADKLAAKIAHLRIFEDADGKMNVSIKGLAAGEVGAEAGGGAVKGGGEGVVGVLAVSQFTLLADARKGRRPYYGAAADPAEANALYDYFIRKIREHGLTCESGVFQTHMEVASINDGPVTILLDSKEIGA